MGSTWESLIKALVEGRDAPYRSEPERDQARRDNLEWIVQTMLEKLRDAEARPMTDTPDRTMAEQRCPICDWPMADSAERGCVPGDCCYRPDDPAEQRRIAERRAALRPTSDQSQAGELENELKRAQANHKDIVATKRVTDARLKVALAALQKIYDESTEDSVSEIAGNAFEEATHKNPRIPIPPTEGERVALQAVWQDWEIANDASGLEDYEIKDVSYADIVQEAIQTFDEWMLDDDYDPMVILRKIISRMRERSDTLDTRAALSQPSEKGR